MNNQEINEMMTQLVEWHQKRVQNCQLVIDNTEADISLAVADGEQLTFAADSKEARGIRIGFTLALQQFTPFPITIKSRDDENDEDFDDE
jgi:hypothetical protein